MATLQGPIFPSREPIAGTELVTPRWSRWFLNLRQSVDSASVAVKTVSETGQTGSLPLTQLDAGNLSAGLYGVLWYLSVVTAQAASTAQVTISWVDGGTARSYTGAVLDGSIAANTQPTERLMFYADGGTPVSYSLAYTGTFTYDFRIVLQSVSA